eukprot:4765564-Prymnesium_polylepis.2
MDCGMWRSWSNGSPGYATACACNASIMARSIGPCGACGGGLLASSMKGRGWERSGGGDRLVASDRI